MSIVKELVGVGGVMYKDNNKNEGIHYYYYYYYYYYLLYKYIH